MRVFARLILVLRQARPELFSLVVVSLIMSGLWAFAELADEVMDGEAHSFDRAILLALRSPGHHNDPLGSVPKDAGHFVEFLRKICRLGR